MVQLKCVCPECKTESHHFVVYLGHVENEKVLWEIPVVETFALVLCCKCKSKFIANFTVRKSLYNEAKEVIKDLYSQKAVNLLASELSTIPEPKEPYSHPSFPHKVAKFFTKLQQEEDPVIKLGIARAVLEVALNEVGAEGKTLYEKIQDVYEKRLITASLAEWSHIVRKFGNKALHELEAETEEAKEVENFCKFFLDLLFRIPAEIEAARSES
ncbi:DUF4145 domain-containing protein [Desulfurobacterium indicum]|uniref:DUF4145 domain-containing protein n=1 Tax=Desulfurobacterium indicum TaxID=1914305 RepID=A0A1R1MJQ8_9BACT|nr:DUF4145 domain-containing protein [Desulfurobacterium indicum]OMH39934.1 hypothetical protein BLW93_07870 [Desulfurobacterium indicum]